MFIAVTISGACVNLTYFDDIECPSRIRGASQSINRDDIEAFAKSWGDSLLGIKRNSRVNHDKIRVSEPFLLALRNRLIHGLDRPPAIIASFGYDDVRFNTHAYANDTVTLILDVESKRLSASNPQRGIVITRQTLINQHNQIVLSMLDNVLVQKRQS
ncbi:MaoC family dehydratase [Pararhodobacter zhoushanensis]|uniref:Uncharacterized protein n=1 Tax=Pararhodobacter zhoushanensis TaxID=2479545 RepID=A0ABT3GZ36_9RHOB|nr:hypothetical protein [Pararhodobacter zhoushanensis]MCW1932825.1 hypothetical protein [Pararhodobacter zhoushanensis]